MSEEQEIPEDLQPVQSAVEIIQPDLTIPPLETQTHNMEVHHHPDLHHKRKNFKEYVLEFLMIFLAVTMGFYAENLREGISENKKAKELAASLISNLRQDSGQSFLTSEALHWREHKLDTLIQIASNKILPADRGPLYYYAKFLFQNFPYHTEDAVFQQIRNSGGLRYFKNPKLQKEIAGYYTTTQWMENDFNNRDYVNQLIMESFRITSRIFKAKEFGEQRKDLMEGYLGEIHKLSSNPELLNNDSVLFNQLASIAVLEIERSRNFRGFGVVLSQERREIIKDLKTEYGLGNGD